MEDFSRSYWVQHKNILAGAGLCGFVALGYFMWRPRFLEYAVVSMIVLALLSCPFTFKAVRGRLWLSAALIMFAGGFAAVKLGMYNPLGWICALISASAYAMGVCLRWHAPAIR